MTKIPVYLIDINLDDEETGMGAISFVEDPAIESNFICFDKDRKPMMFQVENEMEHKVTGCAIWCNKQIYRYDPAIGEYYVVFNKETIDKIVHKYAKQGLNNLVDLQHDGEMIDGVVMVEYFIKDTAKGINPAGFEDVDDGSLFVTYKIEDDKLWKEMISPDSEFKGFSIEINADIVPTNEYVEVEETDDELSDDEFMNWLDELLKALEEADCEIIMENDKDKWLVNGDGEYWLDEEGNKVPAKCPKCGADVGVYIKGEPVFLCSECGEYLGTVKFPDDEMFSVEVKKKINLSSDDEDEDDGLWSLNFEVERTDIAKAIDQKKSVLIDGKEYWVHSLGKDGKNDVAVLYDPKNDKWETKNIKTIKTWEPTKTTIGEFPEVPKSITDNDDITIQRTVNTGSYSDLIHNRVPVMISYDDEQPQPHTGYRQCAIIAYGYTKRNNECIRVMETYGDSRSAAEGTNYIPNYRLMLTRRCKAFKPMVGVQPWGRDILDSRCHYGGDNSMEPCVDAILESDFNN
jgi:hypothetical protein